MAQNSGLFPSKEIVSLPSFPPVSGSDIACCLCLNSGGSGDRGGDLVLGIALFAFSFFVGLGYTVNSAKEALKYRRYANTAENRIEILSESPETPSSLDLDQSFGNMHALLNPTNIPIGETFNSTSHFSQETKGASPFSPYGTELSTYQFSWGILKEMEQERIAAALCQGLMTLGAGALTVALILALLNDSQRLINQLAISGGAGVGIGAIGYGVKYLILPTEDGKVAYENLLGFPRI